MRCVKIILLMLVTGFFAVWGIGSIMLYFTSYKLAFDAQPQSCLGRIFLMPTKQVISYQHLQLLIQEQDLPTIVAVTLQQDHLPFKSGQHLIKYLVATAHDEVLVTAHEVIVYSHASQQAKTYRLQLPDQLVSPHYMKRYVLQDNELFLLGANETSIDSRVLGVFKFDDLKLYFNVIQVW